MSPTPPGNPNLPPPRIAGWLLPAAAIGLALGLLAAAVIYTQQGLRRELRGQLAHRDGQLVQRLFRGQLSSGGGPEGADPLVALLALAEARLPELPGVWSITLFDPEGRRVGAVPVTASRTNLDAVLRRQAGGGGTASRFIPDLDMDTEFLVAPEGTPEGRAPALEVVLPISGAARTAKAGFARLLLDGAGLALEYERLDANLAQAAWRALGVAGAALAAVLAAAFLRLERANRKLLQANRELALAARTGAIGAVTSHLIHGIKNPLAGLQRFVADRAAGEASAEWADAAAAARRIKGMVDEVTRVLRDEGGLSSFEIGAHEIVEIVGARLGPVAAERQVQLAVEAGNRRTLPNREGNLVLLVLENLATNALQATPAGGLVRLHVGASEFALEFRVTDTGPGLPEPVRESLFTPTVSSKRGGTGLGLAISHQIALRLGGSLTLVRSTAGGSEFLLSVPSNDRKSGA